MRLGNTGLGIIVVFIAALIMGFTLPETAPAPEELVPFETYLRVDCAECEDIYVRVLLLCSNWDDTEGYVDTKYNLLRPAPVNMRLFYEVPEGMECFVLTTILQGPTAAPRVF